MTAEPTTVGAGEVRRRRDLTPLARLGPLLRSHAGDGVASAVALLVSTSATIGLTFALRWLADQGIASHTTALIGRYFLLLAGVVVVLAIATAARFYFVTRLGERVVADLRIVLYAHVMTLDQAFFVATRTGGVLSRMTTDLTLVESLIGTTSSVALRNLLTVTVAMAVMIVVSPALTGFVAFLALLVIAPLFVFGRRVRRLSERAQAAFADAVGLAGETFDGLETVQAFGQERRATARFASAIEAAFERSRARIAGRALLSASVIVMVFGGVALILWRASLAAFVTGGMTPGALLQFVFLSVLAAGGASSLGEAWGDIQKCAGAMARVSEILDARPTIVAPALPRPLPTPARGALAFEHVRFAYPGRPGAWALDDFDLTVRPGERVALVGPSGGGKSTVLRLLLRFYDPDDGTVRLDGVDLREADPREVRDRIAFVGQDAALFSGSAADNLRFGSEGANRDRLMSVVRAAEAERFLAALPGGLDAPLGERAKLLSGGQRQRLAIARALLRDAPILLLDEATSALDAENERLVQAALSEAMRGRTTLVVAHRLATVRGADRIVVVDGGRVVESGRHDDLWRQGGLYAKFARLQFGEAAA